MSKFSKQKVL